MKLYVQDVGFSYAGAPALEHVTFCAMPGECTAVLGGNGAGKSTLLRCIDGILRCWQGRIEADGCPLDGMKPQKRARLIAYVPQEPQFPDGCTVFDAVLLGRTPYPEAQKEDLSLVDGILAKLNLHALAMRRVDRLSGGERQKVAVARALAQTPRILLFDEPTANLDLANQLSVLGMIRELAREKQMTVLVSLHDLNLALRFADRFLLLRDRTVLAAGDAQALTPERIAAAYGVRVQFARVGGHTVVVPE